MSSAPVHPLLSIVRARESAAADALPALLSSLDTALAQGDLDDATRADLRALHTALRRDLALLRKVPDALVACLMTRAEGLVSSKTLRGWEDELRASAPGVPWLRALRPLPHADDAALVAECRGHALPPSGALALEGEGDHTVVTLTSLQGTHAWSVSTGEVVLRPRDEADDEAPTGVLPPRGANGAIASTVFDLATAVRGAWKAPEGLRVKWAVTSPQGTRVALGGDSADGSSGWAQLFEAGSPEVRVSVRVKEPLLTAGKFSADGTLLWIAAGTCVHRLEWETRSHARIPIAADDVCTSADNALFATVQGGVLALWSREHAFALDPVDPSEGLAPTFSWDGRFLLDGSVLSEGVTGARIARVAPRDDGTRTSDTPRTRRVYVGDRYTTHVAQGSRVWETASGRMLHDASVLEFPARAVTAWQRDGRLLACSPGWQGAIPGAQGGHIDIIDVLHDTVLRSFGEARPSVETMAFSPEGEHLAVIRMGGRLEMWGVVAGDLRWSRPVYSDPAEITAIAFSEDGRFLVTGAHETPVCVWDVAEGALLASRSLQAHDPVETVEDEDGPRAARCWHATPEALSSLARWTPFHTQMVPTEPWRVEVANGVSRFTSPSGAQSLVIPFRGPWERHPSRNVWAARGAHVSLVR